MFFKHGKVNMELLTSEGGPKETVSSVADEADDDAAVSSPLDPPEGTAVSSPLDPPKGTAVSSPLDPPKGTDDRAR